MTGKTIRIFLADGEPTGILLAEISNWTGKVVVAPRSQLDCVFRRKPNTDSAASRTLIPLQAEH